MLNSCSCFPNIMQKFPCLLIFSVTAVRKIHVASICHSYINFTKLLVCTFSIRLRSGSIPVFFFRCKLLHSYVKQGQRTVIRIEQEITKFVLIFFIFPTSVEICCQTQLLQNNSSIERFEVGTAVLLKIKAYFDVTPDDR